MILLDKLLTRISICSELLTLANRDHYQRLHENSQRKKIPNIIFFVFPKNLNFRRKSWNSITSTDGALKTAFRNLNESSPYK